MNRSSWPVSWSVLNTSPLTSQRRARINTLRASQEAARRRRLSDRDAEMVAMADRLVERALRRRDSTGGQ